MKSTILTRPFLLFYLLAFLTCSCKKDSPKVNDASATKNSWITTGVWKQKDLVLA